MTDSVASRVYNFSPGPAVLPEPVLQEARDQLMALPGVGMSVLEISHRSKTFDQILEAADANLRKLLSLPDDYHILFLQGGARLQFSMVPMNLLAGQAADYILTGSWGKQAIAEARLAGTVHVAWDGGETHYDHLPSNDQLQLHDDAAYVHFTSNETIQGVQFGVEPGTGKVPLVCDASSDFLSRPLDIPRYGLIYACAQKNVGPAGVTVVILRNDLLDRVPDNLPGMLNYRFQVEQKSCYNTPPVFGVYMVRLVTQWLLDTFGTLDAVDRHNRQKAAWLYDAVDRSQGFYAGHAALDCRSLMNVTFRLRAADGRAESDEALQKQFVAEAAERGLCELKGHRSVGGIRASIYNAMPPEGVAALAEFMDDFRDRHA
ncbi:MAG: 3-phosphoserine/phosphohydroxythreonine transaminase [Planctomycetales bacterium]|nr:3-phosphoserine/phosphohydroxythreonine transaminase [Planctomycetales bacterium]NIM10138.1 3-phosphoserine/phosphohydroxythreonine transaminase [Planctomycetales bacterium]NIN08380.1 3-phosphoserine/phosphohydroxythreonine transaminase [Planctomycetales bacterium]NIN77508.1 3-phosphoserine/phosphohydroxythreonine transaminase [Planctomycetales bacterium]NIO34680.1 3-phosphoserine/phosphohydroxythreonine transaminase [Planctomycetales bacterium]